MSKVDPHARSATAVGLARQQGGPCKFLRSKEMFYEQPGTDSDDLFASDTFWCARTQEAFGPDGDAAGKSECQCGRSCYFAL
jgi:hypothetical protein